MRNEIIVSGMVNKDGKLAMYMAELNDFMRKRKNEMVIARFKTYKKGSSSALRGYYFNYVVPTMKMALWQSGDRKTDSQTEEYLRSISPVTISQESNEKTGDYRTEIRRISDLDNRELIEHIEFIKQMAAEEYSVYIDDPSSI